MEWQSTVPLEEQCEFEEETSGVWANDLSLVCLAQKIC